MPSNINLKSLQKMPEPKLSSVPNGAYTHATLREKWFYLDRILDETKPLFSPTSLPDRDLGTLSTLPNELLYAIFNHLSIIDLMRFRRCNRLSHRLITSTPSLRTILHTAPNTIKGILALQISTHITLTQLHQKLTQRFCDGCGELAGLIYLPTCQRACFNCLHTVYKLYCDPPKTKKQLVDHFRMTPDEIAALPTLCSLPGTFTDGTAKFEWRERTTMYFRPGKYLNQGAETCSILYERMLTEGYRELWNRRTGNKKPVLVREDPLPWQVQYHMTSVLAPWLDPEGEKGEEGVFCANCVGEWNEDQVYDKVSFREHQRKDCRVKPRRVGWWRDAKLWLCGIGEDK